MVKGVAEAKWQHCVFHFHKNILHKVHRQKREEVAAVLKAIYAQEDAISTRERILNTQTDTYGLESNRLTTSEGGKSLFGTGIVITFESDQCCDKPYSSSTIKRMKSLSASDTSKRMVTESKFRP
jgi:hypothetical protein